MIGFTGGSRVRQSLIGAEITCGDHLVALLSAACVLLDLPQEQARVAWPWLPENFRLAAGDSLALEADEVEALENVDRARKWIITSSYPSRYSSILAGIH